MYGPDISGAVIAYLRIPTIVGLLAVAVTGIVGARSAGSSSRRRRLAAASTGTLAGGVVFAVLGYSVFVATSRMPVGGALLLLVVFLPAGALGAAVSHAVACHISQSRPRDTRMGLAVRLWGFLLLLLAILLLVAR